MLLRWKVLIVFVVVNLITFGGLGVYLVRQGERSRERFRNANDLSAERAKLAIDSLMDELQDAISGEIARILDQSPDVRHLPLRIRESSVFDSELFRRVVRRAVLIRTGERPGLGAVEADSSVRVFNLRRRHIFGKDELDRAAAVDLVARAQMANRRLQEGGHLAGPLTSKGGPWGGFYLALSPFIVADPGQGFDPQVRLAPLILVVAPGALLLLGFIWVFISRAVIGPIEEMERMAQAMGSGDYGHRLPATSRRDEIGRLIQALNRMQLLLREYHEEMEGRISQKMAEIERKNRELMLGQRLAATGALASGIAHEINNPLGGMLNALQWLKKPDLTEEQRARYAGILQDGIERIGGIVRKVLSFSPQRTTPQPLVMAEVIRRALDLVQHRAQKRDIELRTELDPDLPRVLGDSHEIGQVFLNLLINAIDACYDGGRVVVRTGREGDTLTVEVSDNGSGMTPETAARAFDLFFTTKDSSGTGLGLATVHSLVESHGGSIDLWTAPGQGSRFTVRLPIIRDAGGAG